MDTGTGTTRGLGVIAELEAATAGPGARSRGCVTMREMKLGARVGFSISVGRIASRTPAAEASIGLCAAGRPPAGR